MVFMQISIGIQKLRKIAEATGFNQGQIASACGITQQAISHYFSGKRKNVDPIIAMKIISRFSSIKLEDFYRF